MPGLKLEYVELPSHDLSVSEAFYRDVFGWTFTWYGDRYLAFHHGDGGGEGGFRPESPVVSGGVMPVLFAEDLEAIFAVVSARSDASIVNPIFSFPGGRRFEFKDPSGNILGVWSDAEPVDDAP